VIFLRVLPPPDHQCQLAAIQPLKLNRKIFF
jgi:hypothetical protein